MHHFRSIRRLALGAAVAGAAIGAVPAMANAASTCSFNPSLKRATIVDNSGPGNTVPLRVVRTNTAITFADGNGPVHVCANPGTFNFATINNTDDIWVTRGPASGNTVKLDESAGVFGPGATPESTGTSEIETTVFGTLDELGVIGTSGPDTIRVASASSVDLNGDDDTDLNSGLTGIVSVIGGDGNDYLSGRGFHGFGSTFARVTLHGGEGNDILLDSLDRSGDVLFGEAGFDELFSQDFRTDQVSGGPDIDLGDQDVQDVKFLGDDIEQLAITDVGRLRLAPHVLRARAGKTARLTMSWKHPKAWRELRRVKLGLYRGNEAVGMINARPGSGRLTGTGAVELMSGSRLSHHGKWVTAKLALRLPKSLAGQNLRLAVQATDRHGHRQLEPDAGAIHVAK